MTRPKQGIHANRERWLVSYADFITLLFAFFVVLFASAQVDRKRVAKLADAIEVGFQELGSFSNTRGARQHDDEPTSLAKPSNSRKEMAIDSRQFDHLRSDLERSLAREIERREVSIHMGPDGLVLSLREIGFFDTGSSQMRSSAKGTFGRIAGVLAKNPYRLRIEGHTDDIPIHNPRFQSNWELSTARATEVVRLMVIQYGLAPDHLAAAGYAEFHPAGDNSTVEGRQINRRVDIVVLAETTPSLRSIDAN